MPATVTQPSPTAAVTVSARLNDLAAVYEGFAAEMSRRFIAARSGTSEERTELRAAFLRLAIDVALLEGVEHKVSGPPDAPYGVEIMSRVTTIARDLAAHANGLTSGEINWRLRREDATRFGRELRYAAIKVAKLEEAKADPRLIHLRCPSCTHEIDTPFSRISGPIAFVHVSRYRIEPCYLIITPDPIGDAHRVHHVSAPSLLYTALQETLDASS